jgi:3-hydroxybutyryl-CoA dehydratase
MPNNLPHAIRAGDHASFEFSFTEDELAAYRRLSGDTNPLHSDAAFAAAQGFSKPVVFGGLLVAMISRMIGNQLPGPGCVWHSLTIRFIEPLFVGETGRLEAVVNYLNDDLKVAQLVVTIKRGETLLSEAKVQLGFSAVHSAS